MMVLRSPSLAREDAVCVVRLYEPLPFARGGLAQLNKKRDFTLHLTPPEMKRLTAKWGKPHRNPKTRIDEYAFPHGSLKKLEGFASGGGVGYAPTMSAPLTAPEQDAPLRTRNSAPITDYYTYGMGPEAQFYSSNVAPGAPAMVHLPTTPTTGPATQSAGGSGSGSASKLAMVGGALSGVAGLADLVGKSNAVTEGAGTLGSLASGDYAGALKSGAKLYDSLSAQPTAAGSATTASTNFGKALGTASDLYGIYGGIERGDTEGYLSAAKNAASLAGYDVDKIPIVGAYNIAKQLGKGDVGGAGVTAASLATPLAGLGFAAANLANKSLTAHGDENRNLQAFMQDNPLGLQAEVYGPTSRTVRLGGWLTGDNQLLSQKYIQDLAGAYYGMKYAPDGNQQYWTDQYNQLKANPVQPLLLKGYTWRDGRFYQGDNPVDTYINGKKVARGGALHAAASERHVRGPGTGRSDSIPAQLSDGEYVLTAEDVALLGDGSNEAGAKRLDEFRQQLRKHKGGALARGKISPNAKAPMQYLRGSR